MNAFHLLAILRAIAMRRYGTKRIDQCVVLSASIEAMGRRNWLSIHPISPRKPPGSYTNKQNNTIKTNALHSLAILMAMVMHWYGTERIDRCVLLSASIEATGHHNWLSI